MDAEGEDASEDDDAGEGDEAPAPLGSARGAEIVGRRVRVWWKGDDAW